MGMGVCGVGYAVYVLLFFLLLLLMFLFFLLSHAELDAIDFFL